jgi:hypothetical protein
MKITWDQARQFLEKQNILFEQQTPSLLKIARQCVLLILGGGFPAFMMGGGWILAFFVGAMVIELSGLYYHKRLVITPDRMLT